MDTGKKCLDANVVARQNGEQKKHTMEIDYMKELLKKIQEQRERTGLRIIDNPYTLGADVINNNGKKVYSGDNVSCQLFVSKADSEVLKLNKAHVSGQLCPHCQSCEIDYIHDFTMEKECYKCGKSWA